MTKINFVITAMVAAGSLSTVIMPILRHCICITINHAEQRSSIKTEHGSCGTVPFVQETLWKLIIFPEPDFVMRHTPFLPDLNACWKFCLSTSNFELFEKLHCILVRQKLALDLLHLNPNKLQHLFNNNNWKSCSYFSCKCFLFT